MMLDDLQVALLRNSHVKFYDLDWVQVFDLMADQVAPDGLAERFVTQWVTHGAKIRAEVMNDVRLAAVLRKWLPPYDGPAMRLFRGESADRFDSGRVGLCWTPRREVAEIFASGLNAPRPGGGVLIEADVSTEAIIAGPCAHSRYLGEDEYTVEPSLLPAVRVLTRYRPADRRKN
jgi:hypothetical protein